MTSDRASAGKPEAVDRGRDIAIADAVRQCIEFGMHDIEKPPIGHWLMDYWLFGRAIGSALSRTL